jgi:hypothetical protein
VDDVNEAFEALVLHKAKLIAGSKGLRTHISGLTGSLQIEDCGTAAILGAIDAMVYDMATAADFTKQKGDVRDWSSYAKRREFILKYAQALLEQQ